MEQLDDLLTRLSLTRITQQKTGKDPVSVLPEFRHTFSHFHLDITPVVIDCQQRQQSIINEVNKQKWYDLKQPVSVGLAASTKKLLTLLS